MSDGLKEAHRNKIIEVLSSNPRVINVLLFGSRALGAFSEGSDVDIALVGDELTLDDQADLMEALEKTSIPQRIDLLLHKKIESQALLEHIEQHGVEWFRRSTTEARES